MSDQNRNDLMRVADFFDVGNDDWEDNNARPPIEIDKRYLKKEFLASGGMKEISKVYDTKMRRYVAMAELKTGGPLWHCESFLKEAYLTSSLVHPNIISVHTVGMSADDAPYFVMELKIGQTLRDVVAGAEDKQHLLQIFLKVCDAVSYAHSVGVMHLDIKPENIQVGEHGLVKLCDWGLACRLDEMENEPDLVRGTPGFMSPEQVTKGDLGFHSDIYSLGALLYFILTGEAPFKGGVETKLSSTLEGKTRQFSEGELDIPVSDSLDAVVKHAMEIEPDMRYSWVEDMQADVTKFLSGYSTSVEDAGLAKECLLFYKRNRAACLVAAAFMLILTLTVTISIQNLREGKRRIEQSYAELSMAQQREQQAHRESKASHKKYIAEKRTKIRVSTELKSRKTEEAYAAMLYPLYFVDPVGAVEKSMSILLEQEEDEFDRRVEQQIVINLFISQQFHRIEGYSATATLPLGDIAEKYGAYEKTADGVLSDDDFLEFLKDVNQIGGRQKELRDSIFERMIYYHKARKKESYVDSRILIELIKSMNQRWSEDDLKIYHNSRKIVLSGRGLKRICGTEDYHSKKCIMSLIKLESLMLDRTGIDESYQFTGLKVDRLVLNRNPINSLQPHSAFDGVKILHFYKVKVPKGIKSQAPEKLKIRVEN